MAWGRILLACARFAVTTLLVGWLLVLSTLAVGGRVAGWPCALGVVAGLLALRDRRLNAVEHVVAASVSLGVLLLGLMVSVVLPDSSFDANLYHFSAVLALADGWNPIWDRHSELVLQLTHPDADDWVRHYPKAIWMWGASVYSCLHNVDAGKVAHWLAWLAAVGPAYWFFRCALRCRQPAAWIAAGLAASSPITISQLTTGYVDGTFAGLLTVFVLGSFLGVRLRSGRLVILACLAAVLLIDVKYTGLVVVAVCSLVVLVYALGAGGRRAAHWGLRAAPAVVVALILGFDSYGLNAIEQHNPFHPAWSAQGGSVIAWQASPAFQARNRLDRLLRSVGARQRNADQELVADPAPRIPFVGVRWSHRYDTRFGGFGPLFWEALLLALVTLPLRRRGVAWLAIAAVLASTLATEAAWWARLVPQVWLLPLLLACSARAPSGWSRRLGRVAGALVTLLLVANLAIVGCQMGKASAKLSRTWFEWVVHEAPDDGRGQFLANDSLRRCLERRARDARSINDLAARPPAGTTIGWLVRVRLGLGLGL